jgi:hypothetical protein
MRHNYKSIYSGLVIDKHKGSKGSRIISIQNIFDAKIVGLDILGNDEIYQIINKGDSILKNNNSYFINVYSKRKDKFKYLDSLELWHY